MVKAQNIKYVGIISLIGTIIGMFFTLRDLFGTDFEPLLPLIGFSMFGAGVLILVFSLHIAAMAQTIDEIHENMKK